MDEPDLLRSAKRAERPGAVDDAGAPIRGIDLRDLPIAEGEAGRPMRRFVKQLKTTAGNEGSVSGRGRLIVAGLTVLVFVGWGMLQSRMPVTLTSLFAVLGVLMAVSWVVTRRVGLSVQRGGIARTIAARGYCGGCGYDLRTAGGPGSRFVECPECGARWLPGRLLSVPLGSTDWDPLGKGSGRVAASAALASDDRGALVRRIRSVPWRAPRKARRSWSAEQRRGMWQARRRCGMSWRLLATVLGLALLGFMTWLLLAATFDSVGALPIGFVGTLVVFAAVLFVATWIDEAGVTSDRFAGASRDAGVCAACGTSIDDAPIDNDGFRVCTRCRSAWASSP